MENELFNIPEKELQRIETLVKSNEVNKDELILKTQLVILYKLEQFGKRITQIEERWMVPLIHENM